MANYLVVVGNIGTVYDGTNEVEAVETYLDYYNQSDANYGRAAGEDVTLFTDGEITRGHYGWRGEREGL